MTAYYCAHCAQRRPLKVGYQPTDPRFAIVRCSGHDYPAHAERKKAIEALRVQVPKPGLRKATPPTIDPDYGQ